jgi:hypothetical protein
MLEPFSVSFIGWICLQQEEARRLVDISVIARQVIMLEEAKTLVAKVSAFVVPQIMCFVLWDLCRLGRPF